MRLTAIVFCALLAGAANAQSLVEARDPGLYALSVAPDTAGAATVSGRPPADSTATLLQRTTHFCARLHTSFGVRFSLSADFGTDTLPVEVAIAQPATVNHAGVTQDVDHTAGWLQAGQPHYFGWTFDDPAKLRSGRWHILLNHGGVQLLDQPFDIDFTCSVPIS